MAHPFEEKTMSPLVYFIFVLSHNYKWRRTMPNFWWYTTIFAPPLQLLHISDNKRRVASKRKRGPSLLECIVLKGYFSEDKSKGDG
jgi:hypothetical protein